MIALTLLALAMTSPGAGDSLATPARAAITELVRQELLGHYDVESVELLEVKERDGELVGPFPGYGLRTVRAAVHVTRNQSWSRSLHEGMPDWPECDRAASLFLLCRPAGFRFRAEVEVEMAATTDGWRILSRNLRSLRRYPLEKYLICPADKPGATDGEIIRGCFAPSPGNETNRR